MKLTITAGLDAYGNYYLVGAATGAATAVSRILVQPTSDPIAFYRQAISVVAEHGTAGTLKEYVDNTSNADDPVPFTGTNLPTFGGRQY